MARYQAITELLLQWSERGGSLPDKVKRELDDLANRGDSTRGVMGKLGDAFQRLERREPTLVMRQMRVAVEDLGASALGASGPLGRLAVNFATLGTGGLVGSAAIAGIAGLGFEFKALIGQADHLEASMVKASDAIAHFGGQAATQWIQVRELRHQIEELNKPGFWEGFFFKGFTGITEPMRITRESQQASARQGLNLLLQQQAEDRQRKIEQHAEEEHRKELDRIRELDAELKRIGQPWTAMLTSLEGFGGHVSDVTVRLQTQNLSLKEQATIVRDLDLAYRQLAVRLNLPTSGAAATLPFTTTRPFPTLRGPEVGQIPYADYTPGYGPDTRALEPGESRTLPILVSLLSLAGSARGGASGILAGIGGVATAAGAGPAGAIIGAVSGLISLFSGGHARITISRFEEEAERQMTRVLRLPAYYSSNVISNDDSRATLSRLDRAQRLDTVRRGY